MKNIKITCKNKKYIIKAEVNERENDPSPTLQLSKFYKLKKLLRLINKKEKEHTLILSGITC